MYGTAFAAFFTTVRCLLQLVRPRYCAGTSLLLCLIFSLGELVLHYGRNVSSWTPVIRWLEPSATPWSSVHSPPSPDRAFSLQEAISFRETVPSPFWEEGADPILSSLAGAYPRRSVILLVLESHGLWNMQGREDGKDSPYFWRLQERGVTFENYVSSGLQTHSALWSLLTGLPQPPPAFRRWGDTLPFQKAGIVGKIPDFRKAGYQCQSLCPTPPTFDGWQSLMVSVGVDRWWIAEEETRGMDRRFWTSWGMPDDQLYAILWRRWTASSSPVLFILLTVSNHWPFDLPSPSDGRSYSPDHHGGMQYADHCLEQLILRWDALPTEERPILFITADHAVAHPDPRPAPDQTLLAQVLIPGLLLLPDGKNAGLRYPGLFCHEDVLDLLFMITTPSNSPSMRKFLQTHRVMTTHGGTVVLSVDYAFLPERRELLRRTGLWKMEPVSNPAVEQNMQKAWNMYKAAIQRMFPQKRTL